MRDLNDPHTDDGTSSGGQLMAACEHLTMNWSKESGTDFLK
jgi:hypothetical protein